MITNTETYGVDGIEITFRTEKEGDKAVIQEVIVEDCYGLKKLKQEGFEPKTILDIGAHIGCFTLLANKLWPDAHIICFEPLPRSYEILRLNTDYFASCDKRAVYYGKNLIYTDGIGATGGGFIITAESWAEHAYLKKNMDYFIYEKLPIEIESATIEDIFQEMDLDNLDLLKLDCEASEFNIIENMEQWTADKIKRVVGEYHSEGGFESLKFVAENKFTHLTFHTPIEILGRQPIGYFYSELR